MLPQVSETPARNAREIRLVRSRGRESAPEIPTVQNAVAADVRECVKSPKPQLWRKLWRKLIFEMRDFGAKFALKFALKFYWARSSGATVRQCNSKHNSITP